MANRGDVLLARPTGATAKVGYGISSVVIFDCASAVMPRSYSDNRGRQRLGRHPSLEITFVGPDGRRCSMPPARPVCSARHHLVQPVRELAAQKQVVTACRTTHGRLSQMFRCQLCQTVVPAGTPAQKIVMSTRSKSYAARGTQRSSPGEFRPRGRRNSPPPKPYDKGGEGQEIVREANVCPACAAKYQATTQADQ